MDTHVRNLGVLSITFGVLSILVPLSVLLYFGSVSVVFNNAENAADLGFVSVVLIFSHLIVGGPFIAAGWYVMQYQNWARSILMALCGVSLLLIPFGTVLAVYGFWVLMTPETEPLFSDPPARSGPKPPQRLK